MCRTSQCLTETAGASWVASLSLRPCFCVYCAELAVATLIAGLRRYRSQRMVRSGLCWLHAWCITQCTHLSSYSQDTHHHSYCFAAYQNNDITANARTHLYRSMEGTRTLTLSPYGQVCSFGPLRLSTSMSCLQHVKRISTQAWLLCIVASFPWILCHSRL